jgi:hypothetical protein
MDFFWKKPKWEQEDRHLSALKAAPFQRGLPPVTLSPGVTLIRGPRQVGKSTWLKLLLKEQVDAGVSCFYTTRAGEVDFMLGKEKAVEIKWAPVVHNLSNAYKNLLCADKRVWNQGSFFDLD